jgi:hypothetical protein
MTGVGVGAPVGVGAGVAGVGAGVPGCGLTGAGSTVAGSLGGVWAWTALAPSQVAKPRASANSNFLIASLSILSG